MLLKGRSQTTLSLCTETPTCPFDTSAQDGPEVPTGTGWLQIQGPRIAVLTHSSLSRAAETGSSFLPSSELSKPPAHGEVWREWRADPAKSRAGHELFLGSGSLPEGWMQGTGEVEG